LPRHLQGQFDMPEDGPVAVVEGHVGAVYEHMIIPGIARAAAREAASAASAPTRWIRMIVTRSGEAPVAAADFWRVLRDWPALLKWSAEADGSRFAAEVKLRPGQSVDVLPCTRVCYDRPEAEGGVPIVEETLFHADEAARRIYYNVEGVIFGGMRNYVATTTVDELDAGRCLVTCMGQFDVHEGGPAEDIAARVAAVYETMVIPGIARVAAQERGVNRVACAACPLRRFAPAPR